MFNAIKEGFSDFVREPKDICFEGEEHDEKIILFLRRDVATNITWILTAMFLILLPSILTTVLSLNNLDPTTVVPARFISAITMLWYMFVFAFIFENYLIWYFNIYIVTNKRIVDMDFMGLLSRKVSEAPIQTIQDVTYDVKGFFANIFDFGTVHIQTAGEKTEFDFESVPKANVVHDVISDLATEAITGSNPRP